MHIAGYTDNGAIRSALQKKYQTNQELSDARADHAAQAQSFRPVQCLETVVRLLPAFLTLKIGRGREKRT